MREIKFRIWSSCWNLMIYLDGFKYVNDRIIQIYYKDEEGDISSSVVSLKDATLEQYTGLKGKNGKEIYEGDIIRTHFNLDDVTQEPFVIIWDEERAMFIGEKQGNTIDDYLNTFSFFPEQRFLYEVIGNIHENPELLEAI